MFYIFYLYYMKCLLNLALEIEIFDEVSSLLAIKRFVVQDSVSELVIAWKLFWTMRAMLLLKNVKVWIIKEFSWMYKVGSVFNKIMQFVGFWSMISLAVSEMNDRRRIIHWEELPELTSVTSFYTLPHFTQVRSRHHHYILYIKRYYVVYLSLRGGLDGHLFWERWPQVLSQLACT